MAIERRHVIRKSNKIIPKCQSHIEAFENITNRDLIVLGISIPTIFVSLADAIDTLNKIVNGNFKYLTGREVSYIYTYDFFVTKSGYTLTKPKDVFVKLLTLTKRLEYIELDDGVNMRLIEHYHESILKTSLVILNAVRESQ